MSKQYEQVVVFDYPLTSKQHTKAFNDIAVALVRQVGDTFSDDINIEDIIPIVTSLMRTVGKISTLTGQQKKELVVGVIETVFQGHVWAGIIASPIIDCLISVEKGNIIFNPNTKKVAKGIFACCRK